MLLFILMIVSIVGSLFVAFLTVLKNPHLALHRWLFAFLLAASAWAASTNLQGVLDPGLSVILLRLGFVAASLYGLCMVRFVAVLCGHKYELKWKIIDGGLAVAAALLSLSPLVIQSYSAAADGSFVPVRGIGYPLAVACTTALVIRSIVLLQNGYQRSRGQKRIQLGVVYAGILAGTIIGMVTNVILPNIVHTTYPSRFAFLAIIAWTSLLVYAIWRHRFLDIRWAAARAIVYSLTILTIAGVYALGVVVVGNYATNILQPVALQVYFMIAGVVAAIIFGPLRAFFDRLTNRVFFSDTYRLQQVLDDLGALLAETVNVDRIMKGSLDIIGHAIRPDRLFVVLLPTREHNKPVVVTWGRKILDVEAVLPVLVDSPPVTVVSDIFEQEPSHSQRVLSSHGIAAITPLQTPKNRIGYILMGYKQSGHLLSREDVDLIRLAGDQVALALENGLRFKEIQEFNRTLQQRIEEATKELQASNAKLQQLDEAKDEFISMASHQLRTPLTSVKGYLSMALEGDAGALKPDQSKLLQEAYDSAERMVYLIGDFLNVSRLQTGKFIIEHRPVNLVQVVQDEIRHLAATAARRQITLKFTPPKDFPILQLDENKIRQVVMNFIDNAIFYSSPNSAVVIELTADARQVCLRLYDTGIGVPADEQHKVFTKFFRGTNARKVRPDGTGIGLFMAKKIIVAHGGAMIFESQEGKGSTFGFCMPLAAKGQKKET